MYKFGYSYNRVERLLGMNFKDLGLSIECYYFCELR